MIVYDIVNFKNRCLGLDEIKYVMIVHDIVNFTNSY